MECRFQVTIHSTYDFIHADGDDSVKKCYFCGDESQMRRRIFNYGEELSTDRGDEFHKKVNSLTSFSVPSRHVHVRKLAACSYPTFNLVQAQNQKSVKRRDKGK